MPAASLEPGDVQTEKILWFSGIEPWLFSAFFCIFAPVRILLSNDDGYLAPGLACLAAALRPLAELIVVAPERDRSGASNSLTLSNPLHVRQGENGFLYVDGTPTDCVHLAITGLMDEEPDMVIAGINRGANLGDDVIYSGTVAAAMEGRFLGLPAIAVSLVGPKGAHYASAADVVIHLFNRLQQDPLPADTILNVNVPDLPLQEIAGLEATRLGHRHKAEPAIRDTDPYGSPIYWVGPSGAEADAGPGTDFFAIKRNFVSITPLQVDLTRYAALDQVSSWLNKNGKLWIKD
ncbi:MAG TPA: 5'/3'-nucleotidase SurE [Acidiferrobacterales bacterium]|nr:5'/3'-nucleotidase SurE [Acidiferrobacterales bacterium]